MTGAGPAFGARARAPLRLGLAGGGTDLSPFCDEHGGQVLNVTIARYASAMVLPRTDGAVSFVSNDLQRSETLPLEASYPVDMGLSLHRAIYNRFVRDHNGGRPLAVTLVTEVDCPMGSGLGASSALVVAAAGAFAEVLGVQLDPAAAAHLAFVIERRDLAMAGGRQDQYAAAFGGFNLMKFGPGEDVRVEPAGLDHAAVHELEDSLLLCFTGTSRVSSDIIANQVHEVSSRAAVALDAMTALKRDADAMLAALRAHDFAAVAAVLNRSWEAKKRTASGVSTPEIDAMRDAAMAAGAVAAKISGAGGGGFMMCLVPPERRDGLRRHMIARGTEAAWCSFARTGMTSWQIPVPAGHQG